MKVIDIASHQSSLDLGRIDVEGVIVKATEGTGYVNPVCDRHVQQARNLGKKIGVYHYAGDSGSHRLGDPRAEAEYFVRNIEGYLPFALLVLDFEEETGREDWADAWIARLMELTGRTPMIYMSESVVFSNPWAQTVGRNVGLWIAKYRDMVADWNWDMSLAGNKPAVKDWPFYAMWQWTSSGRLNGYDGNLDLNEFYGDGETWDKYVGAAPGQPVPVPSPPAPAPAPEPSNTYTVNPGDTLSGIAAKFGTTWQHLQAINGLANPNYIRVGQVLRVTGEPVSQTYTVQPGDNLSAIASRFGTTWQRLQQINGIPDANRIFPGQVLRVG